MTRFIQEGPMWRRALLAMVAMLSASAAFVVVVMLVLGSIVDLALSPASGADEVESAGTVSTPQEAADSKSPEKDTPATPGERS